MPGERRVYLFSIARAKLGAERNFLAELKSAGVVVDDEYGEQPRDPRILELSLARGRANDDVVRKLKAEFGIDAFAEPVQQPFEPDDEE
jgi:hypothetical protein